MLRPDDISAVFEWVELLLIKSLKRNLSRHKQEEQDEGFNWTAWQAEKLRNVDTFRRQSKAIMDRYTDVIDSETRELLEEQFAEGVNGADVPPAESVPDTPAEVTPEPHFFGVDKTKVNKLIEDVSYLEKNAETAALRLTDDVYRQTVNRVQFAMSTGSISYGQAVDMAVADFLTQGINCIEYKDGRRVNIADYVRMVLRTTSTRAALQGKSAKFKAQGYDTVLVSSYGMCSKTCLPWQGRAYIEDTFSYWDGEVEERNGILYGKSNYCGKWFPLLSSAIEKGLFHPNCRHSINLYIEGVTDLPEPMDNTDIERRYKLEQRQRALEREVRKAKRKVEGFTDAENIKKAKAELREAQKNVREYIAKVNAEEGGRILVRDPVQEKIYSGDVRIGSSAEPVHAPESMPANVSDGHSVEVDIPAPDNGQPEYTDTPIPKNVNNSSVDKSGGSGIIESKKKSNFVPAKTKQEAVEYAHKFAVNVDYDKLSLENANIINETLDELTAKYPTKKLETIKPGKGGAMSGKHNQLTYNKQYLGETLKNEQAVFLKDQEAAKRSIEEIKERYKAKAKMPFSAELEIQKNEEVLKYKRYGVHASYTQHLKVVTTHEYGHIIADQYFGQMNKDRANINYLTNWRLEGVSRKWEQAFEKAKSTGDIYNLSQYSSKNVYEFFAESFAAREMGEKLPDYVEELMKEVLDNGIM